MGSVTNLSNPNIYGMQVQHGHGMAVSTRDAVDTEALPATSPPMLFLDPAGGAVTIHLPPEADSKGLMFIIVNTADAAEAITVEEDSSTTAIIVLDQGQMGICVCDGVTWRGMIAANT